MLLTSLTFIVCAAMIFCNALEHLGERLGISEGVTGSIFAAIGTALPETIIPILSFTEINSVHSNMDIGIGAILGAPLMLSTLSLFVMAVFILNRRGLTGAITPELNGLRRDIKFFLLSYLLVLVASVLPGQGIYRFIRITLALSLPVIYFIYLLLTIRQSADRQMQNSTVSSTQKLLLNRLGLPLHLLSILLQLILSMVMLVYSADMFIDVISKVAVTWQIQPFILSLVIIPIATELPEKINSIIWLYKSKDTLAMSNITGALVFQGSILPMLGILVTDWKLEQAIIINIIITLVAVLWIYFNAYRNNLRVWHFLLNGVLYLLNIGLCVFFR